MTRVVITTVKAVPPRGYFIQWAVRDPGAVNYAFTLERSGGPDGPWTTVARDYVNQWAYFDVLPQPEGQEADVYTRPNPFHLFATLYYRVTTVENGATLQDVFEMGPSAVGPSKMYRAKMARDVRIALRKYVGRPAVLLKKKTWGERCPKCYDPKTGAGTRGGCKTCWGTTFKDGYWNPVSIFVKKKGGDAENVGNTPKAEGAAIRVVLADVPQVDVGDVIVVLNTDQRYLVESRDETSLMQEPVHQEVTLTELDRSHVLYAYRVDPRTVQSLI